MGKKSDIGWTNASWNVLTGCDKISPGCDHCYAEVQAEKLRQDGSEKYRNGFQLTLHPNLIDLPKRWTKPRKIFVNSMADLHHKDVPYDFLDKVYGVMINTNRHIYQILTKRSSLMRDYINTRYVDPISSHIWLGVTVENAAAKSRIDHLRATNCNTRFLSIEPLLEDLGEIHLDKISWVIVGCESGSYARPMNLDWVRSIRDQCLTKKVPFFFKQAMINNQIVSSPTLDGQVWNEYPEITLPGPDQKTLF